MSVASFGLCCCGAGVICSVPPWAKLVQAGIGFASLSTNPQILDLGILPKAHYVLLYRGAGAYRVSQSGHVGYMALWGFYLGIETAVVLPFINWNGLPAGGSGSFNGFNSVTPPAGTTGYSLWQLDMAQFDNFAYPPASWMPPMIPFFDYFPNWPFDLATTEPAAVTKAGCFGMEFGFGTPDWGAGVTSAHCKFVYARDTVSEAALTITNGVAGNPVFDLYVFNPTDYYSSTNPCLSFASLYPPLCQSISPYGGGIPGRFNVQAAYTSNDARYGQALKVELVSLTSPVTMDLQPHQGKFFNPTYPNTTASPSSFSATLRIRDRFTNAIVRDDTVLFNVVLAAYSAQLVASRIGGVNGKDEYWLYFINSGNMDLSNVSSATFSGTGFTLVTDFSSYPVQCQAPFGPGSPSAFATRFDIVGQFTQSTVDLTASFSDGARSYNVTWHITGIPL